MGACQFKGGRGPLLTFPRRGKEIASSPGVLPRNKGR